MSLQYYAQGIYLCAKCKAVLGFCGREVIEDGTLVLTMQCTMTPTCPQKEQKMQITVPLLQAPRATE